jgi:hypothetical protein
MLRKVKIWIVLAVAKLTGIPIKIREQYGCS